MSTDFDSTNEPAEISRSPSYWALLANPNRYRIEEVIRTVETDTWTTGNAGVRAGDQFLVWKSLGSSSNRGIVAFGDVLSDPKAMLPKETEYWANDFKVKVEPRVTIRYVVPASLPIWTDTPGAEWIAELTVARGRGRSVFALSSHQWQRVIALVGGWPGKSDVESDSSSRSQESLTSAAETVDSPFENPFDVTWQQDGRDTISRAITARRGQPQFRDALITPYDGRCAVTGTSVRDVLEAAHIMPYRGGSTNDPRNGLLLRSDIHTLFDLGLLQINPANFHIRLDDVLAQSEYWPLDGTTLRLTERPELHPAGRR